MAVRVHEGAFRLFVRAIQLLILVVLLAGMGTTLQAADKHAPAQAPQAAPAAKSAQNRQNPSPAKTASRGGISTGIKVHGHWVIDVKNPDGTVVQHRDFENSLATNNSLAFLLSGQAVAGGWEVDLADSSGVSSPCGVGAECLIAQTGPTYNWGGIPASTCNSTVATSCNLALNLVDSQNGEALALSGSFQATQAGSTVAQVYTHFFYCTSTIYVAGLQAPQLSGSPVANTASPSQCAAYNNLPSGVIQQDFETFGSAFSGTTLSNPITGIQPNQTIAVVVTLSFQ